ncbi:MAG: hypothetical protein RLZZ396_2427 [Planctomycetota bacterium]|jgi:hypothetical protein
MDMTVNKITNFQFGSFVLILLVAMISGCSKGNPKTAAVKGMIKTKQGQPCGKALIVFHPLEKSRLNDPKPVATAEDSGEFVVRTFTLDDGAVPGEYGVTVVWPGENQGNSGLSLSGEGSSGGADRLGGKYGNPKDPKIKVTIPANGDLNMKIEIEG